MLRHNRVFRVTQKVTRLSLKHSTRKPTVTQKCLPFVYESFQNGSLDLKSFEHAAVEMIICDILSVSVCVGYILIKSMYKN